MLEITEELIKTIKHGTPAEVRLAQKAFEKHWGMMRGSKGSPERSAVFAVLLREMRNLDAIAEDDRKAYLINSLRFRLWDGTDLHFEEFRDFVLKYIQHPSGKVRIAIIKACDYLALDCGIPLQFLRHGRKTDISPEAQAEGRRAWLRFGYFVLAVEALLRQYEEPRFRRYKYVQNMPPSVYKSLQQLLVEKLLRTDFYREIYGDFQREIAGERSA